MEMAYVTQRIQAPVRIETPRKNDGRFTAWRMESIVLPFLLIIWG